MQTSTVSPVTNTSNTTTTTKTKEQILIQSSGAMIAVIVIGIIIILAVILLILKTYNRRTHASRVLGVSSSSKPRPRTSQSTVQGSVPLNTMGVHSVSENITGPAPASENEPRLGTEMNSAEGNRAEQFSTASGSSVVTIHDTAASENT
ncbi:noncompact myelin-associated protein [Betta splendens]|uniref:Noncompact myelin-associated protein n=1 Tax=Betta splendens TaxID=158456 RepID=A0A6P7LNZ2_BETSP|nr:noncompact myelin-associated protein [Betta splendens]